MRNLQPDGRETFAPLAKVSAFTPLKPLQGGYFATHFGNFHHAAPIEAVYERVALSATRGYNTLLI